MPISTVFAPIAWTPTPLPPPDTWMSAFGWVAIYWSAAFWTIGRTVVEPLIVMLCFWPDAAGAGAAVVAATTGADTAAGVLAGATAAAVAAGVAAGLADEVFVPLSVQPAIAIDAMSRMTRLKVTKRYELRFAFMVFHLSFHGG
jgi:hypothetical protein